MSRNIRDIPRLDREQIVLFCKALMVYPQETQAQYESRFLQTVKLLKTPLTRPGFISRLYLASQSSYTPLCTSHKPLNASIVHSIFSLLTVEVGVRLNSLIVSGRDKTGHQTWDQSILNLRSLHNLWLPPDVIQKTFGTSLEIVDNTDDPKFYYDRWPYYKSRCEACMLTHIAADFNTLLDLRMVIKSRMYSKLVKRHGNPRLWVWVEAWIEDCWRGWFVKNGLPHEVERNMELNELQASRLKELRKDITREKRSRNEHRIGSRAKRRTRDDISEMTGTTYLSTTEADVQTDSTRSQASPVERWMTGLEEQDSTTAHGLHGAHAVPQKYPPSSPSRSARILDWYAKAERENEAEVIVEEQADNVENEIIDAYFALISTPFLPGMSHEEHEKTERNLSVSYTEIKAKYDAEDKGSSGAPKGPSSRYSESVYSTDDPQHPEYVGARAGWTDQRQPFEADRNRRFTRRTTKASINSSWTDVSVADSELGVEQPGRYASQRSHRYQPEVGRIDTIDEESETSRYSSKWNDTASVLSPKHQQSQFKFASLRNIDTHARRSEYDAMEVSPVSTRYPDSLQLQDTSPVSLISSQLSPRTFSHKRRHEQLPTPEPEPARHGRRSPPLFKSDYTLARENARRNLDDSVRRHHSTKHARSDSVSPSPDPTAKRLSRSRSHHHHDKKR